jgi:hypothetical protein
LRKGSAAIPLVAKKRPLWAINYPVQRTLQNKPATAKDVSAMRSADGLLVSSGVHSKKDRQKYRQLIRLRQIQTAQDLMKSLCNSTG